MNEIATILEQARVFVLDHAPSEWLQETVLAAIICLVAGVGLSVLGAKLARCGMTTAFGILGATAGAYFARETGFNGVVCALVGAVMIGIIGHQTHRMWVGLAAAAVLTSAALGVFGYQRVIPYVAEFEQVAGVPVAGAPAQFAVPSPEQQQAYRDRGLPEWGKEFWAFVAEKDALVAPNARAVGLAALVTGLCLGVLAVRAALILSTSLVGTALVTTGLAGLLTKSVPQSYEAFQQHPGLLGVGVGGFLVSSLVLQTMLTRKAPSDKKQSSGKE